MKKRDKARNKRELTEREEGERRVDGEINGGCRVGIFLFSF